MKVRLWLLLAALFLLLSVPGSAHSGGTDFQGGHYDSSTGEYHFHHGYGPHQHVNGVCPYDNVNATNAASGTAGSASGITQISSTSTNGTYASKWDRMQTPEYQEGYDDGYQYGYDEGYDEGGRKRYTEGYKNGAKVARNSGYSEGYNVGYDEGLVAGEEEGRVSGYDAGRSEGYEEGYDKGVITANERNLSVVAISATIILIMAGITGRKVQKIKNLEKATQNAQADIAQQLASVTKQLKDAHNLYGDLEKIYYSESPKYPWLAKQLADYSYLWDLKTAKELRTKARPAIKAADKLTAIAKEKKELQRKLKEAEYLLSVYQKLYPEPPKLHGAVVCSSGGAAVSSSAQQEATECSGQAGSKGIQA